MYAESVHDESVVNITFEYSVCVGPGHNIDRKEDAERQCLDLLIQTEKAMLK
jgi:hypothetical protein